MRAFECVKKEQKGGYVWLEGKKSLSPTHWIMEAETNQPNLAKLSAI